MKKLGFWGAAWLGALVFAGCGSQPSHEVTAQGGAPRGGFGNANHGGQTAAGGAALGGSGGTLSGGTGDSIGGASGGLLSSGGSSAGGVPSTGGTISGGSESGGAAGEASGGMATGGTGDGGLPDASLTPPDPKETLVSIVRASAANATDLTQTEVRELVRQAVALAGGLDDVIAPGDVVVLKPNLVTDTDFTSATIPWSGTPLATQVNGVTTDWRLTAAVVELVREQAPGTIYIMEGSSKATQTVMTNLGYTTTNFTGVSAVDELIAIDRDSGGWRDDASTSLISLTLPNGRLQNQYYYNRRLYQADVVISLPTLKTHWHAGVTGGVKNLAIGGTPANMYGTSSTNPTRLYNPPTDAGTPRSNGVIVHEWQPLQDWIHDYYLGRPANFVVMDALQGIQNGPTPAYPYTGHTSLAQDQMNMRLVVAGRDAVAVDTVESLIMEWDPQSIPYLVNLAASGAGVTDPAHIRVVGQRVDQVRTAFASYAALPSFAAKAVTVLTPPSLTISSHTAQAGLLALNLTAGADLRRVEVFAGTQLIEPPVISSFDDIVLDTSALASGTYDLRVLGYDRYLNVVEQTLLGGLVIP